MQIEITAQAERHLKRWQQLAEWPELTSVPGKIETDRLGRIIMSPPPLFDHARYVARIIELLREHLPDGQALAETPVVTSDGVKVTDAAWLSAEYVEELESQHPVALKRAPEICVEVLSPSNTAAEMEEKCMLYSEAGAREVWLCDVKGKILFCTPELSEASTLCPEFPQTLG
jgi:Uma2 family endonuclease